MPLCHRCGFELPRTSSFCPNCSASRASAETQPQTEDRKALSGGKACPKCGTVMRVGFMVERDSPLVLWTLGEGVYWAPSKTGVLGERVAVMAYACPGCGYIEHYVCRLEKDRSVILGAPSET